MNVIKFLRRKFQRNRCEGQQGKTDENIEKNRGSDGHATVQGTKLT